MYKILLITTALMLLFPLVQSAQEFLQEGRYEPAPEFVFARLMYDGSLGRRGNWSTDYPAADRKFMWGVQRLTNIRIQIQENAVGIMDPELFKYPFLYVVEPGRGLFLEDDEAKRLREYVDRGGFMVFDDFWGTAQWRNFSAQMKKIFPDREIEELPRDHEIFSVFYEIDKILQVPNIRNGIAGGATHQSDGYVPYVLGVFDENRRLNVVMTYNSDLGDAWEWMDHPQYPELYSGFAYRMGINVIIYSMTH